jgi:mono/diheme cytochrome c family protein
MLVLAIGAGREYALANDVSRPGNRFTGMGAFGKALTDAQIWDLVRFMRSLRDTAPAGK